jgi:hypothetical protein
MLNVHCSWLLMFLCVSSLLETGRGQESIKEVKRLKTTFTNLIGHLKLWDEICVCVWYLLIITVQFLCKSSTQYLAIFNGCTD